MKIITLSKRSHSSAAQQAMASAISDPIFKSSSLRNNPWWWAPAREKINGSALSEQHWATGLKCLEKSIPLTQDKAFRGNCQCKSMSSYKDTLIAVLLLISEKPDTAWTRNPPGTYGTSAHLKASAHALPWPGTFFLRYPLPKVLLKGHLLCEAFPSRGISKQQQCPCSVFPHCT